MAYVTGQGGVVRISKGPTDELDSPYDVEAWDTGDAYSRDDTVSTTSTDGTETKYWLAKVDRTAADEDQTAGASGSDAPTMDADYWEEIELGELVSVIDWTETRPVETNEGVTLLRESQPRSSVQAGAVTLALNLYYSYAQRTARVLREANARVYVQLMPEGEGSGKELRKGYFRVGESSQTGNQADYQTVAVTLTSDGDYDSAAQA